MEVGENIPELTNDNIDSATISGRAVHFGNETGVSFEGGVILSTSEVRNQWLKVRTHRRKTLCYAYQQWVISLMSVSSVLIMPRIFTFDILSDTFSAKNICCLLLYTVHCHKIMYEP